MNKKTIIGLSISILLILISILGVFYYKNMSKIVTVITIDINPSIKLSLNSKNKIVKVEGLNEDGKKVLKTNNLKGNSLEEAIENITTTVIDQGYVEEEIAYVLINVDGEDIADSVVNIINDEFKKKDKSCEVIKNDINESSKNNAKKYGISESKASYIESIIEKNPDLTFDDLKDKTIGEINDVLENKDELPDNDDDKKEDNEEEKNADKENQNSSNNSNNSNSVTTTKPVIKPISTPPASNDRTGAWCEFYKTIPPEGGVDYETPGYISDTVVYVEEAKKHMPSDASWSSYFSSITEYRTASYCSAGVVELENYDKTKTYTMYLDSVTLEVLKLKTTDIVKPSIDEAGARPIVANWLKTTYGVNIDDCDWENYYYNIDGSTKIPEWQYTCKIEETKTYYAVTVVATNGTTKTGYTWTID